MILFINTTDAQALQVGLLGKNRWAYEQTVPALRRQSEELLPAITRSLSACGKKFKEVHGVAVASGPGPFTAVRIGVATANALAYALGVPVVGVKMTGVRRFATLPVQIKQALASKKGRKSVVPAYGKEPNITVR